MKTGLAVSIVAAVLVATFPLYSHYVASYIWNTGQCYGRDEYGGAAEIEVKGRVVNIDPIEGLIAVDGREIMVRGQWNVEYDGITQILDYTDLLSLIAPGDYVIVKCREGGHWELTALEIIVPDKGIYAYRGVYRHGKRV